MLRWRLSLGAVLIAALVGLVWLDATTTPPGAWLLGLGVLLSLLAAQEVISLLAAGGYHPRADVIYGGTLLVVASNAMAFVRPAPEEFPLQRLGWPLLAFTVAFLATWIGEMRRYQKPGGVIVNVALATLGIAYAGLLISFAMHLRLLGTPSQGMVRLAALIAVVKAGDTGAYTVGRLIGRHKMAPVISPGKTWEGVAGALLFASLAAWLVFTQLASAMGIEPLGQNGGWLLFGLVVGATGIVGDLAESLFKRDMGRKDSSTWLPGFGGVLDILDSIIFAAPVAYLCCLLQDLR